MHLCPESESKLYFFSHHHLQTSARSLWLLIYGVVLAYQAFCILTDPVSAPGGTNKSCCSFVPLPKILCLCRKEPNPSVFQGQPGERVDANLEMRILSDIGLVGAPNAGKSSLLRALTAAAPKVCPLFEAMSTEFVRKSCMAWLWLSTSFCR